MREEKNENEISIHNRGFSHYIWINICDIYRKEIFLWPPRPPYFSYYEVRPFIILGVTLILIAIGISIIGATILFVQIRNEEIKIKESKEKWWDDKGLGENQKEKKKGLKFCPKCRNKIKKVTKFCPECGHKL